MDPFPCPIFKDLLEINRELYDLFHCHWRRAQIKLMSYYPEGKTHKAYLINDTHAIASNGVSVSIIEVKPTEDSNTFIQAEPHNYVTVARGGRTESSLIKIVNKLKSMSAYTLITEHFNVNESEFHINGR